MVRHKSHKATIVSGDVKSWVVFYVVINPMAETKLGEKGVRASRSSTFSHREDAVVWFDALRAANTANGLLTKGEIRGENGDPIIIRHCGVTVLLGSRCPKCKREVHGVA